MRHSRAFGLALALLAVVTGDARARPVVAEPDAAAAALPARLSETGLFTPGTTNVVPGALAFSPQYPLWSDGAAKRRWIALPEGSAIDASDPDAWTFPPGTRFWKEFSHDRPVETRLIQRLADGTWVFAAYAWNADGTDAELVPAEGMADLAAPGAPGGRYAVPSREDCLACHDAGPVPVLGFSALQLSPDRDPNAVHAEPPPPGAIDLGSAHDLGILRNLPAELLNTPPRIEAPSPTARSALGYLHGNCGNCHNDDGALALIEMSLRQSTADSAQGLARTMSTTVDRAADESMGDLTVRIVSGSPGTSQLVARMLSRDPLVRMPPLGTTRPDSEAIGLIERWIENDLSPHEAIPE